MKSTPWRWEGLFALDVPNGWVIREPGDLLEIIPENAHDCAAHVSALRRRLEGPPKDGEAANLVASFAARRGLSGAAAPEDLKGDRLTAEAFFRTAETTLSWFVVAHVWEQQAVVCSFCYSPEDATFVNHAKEMFESIRQDLN